MSTPPHQGPAAQADTSCPCSPGASGGLPDGPHLTAPELHAMENTRQLAAWEDYARAFGPVFTVHTEGAAPRVYVGDPAAIRRLFVGNRTTWGARGTLYFRPVIGAQALPYLCGDAHRTARRLLAPPLHGDPVRALGPAIDEIVTTALDHLHPAPTPLIRLAHDIALRVIVRVAFGPPTADRHEACVHVLTEIMDLMYEPAAKANTEPTVLRRHITGHIRQLQALVTEESTAARAQPDRHREDLIHHLATGQPAQNDEQIRGHIMTLLIAGHDTTAGALAWALYQLELHPDIRRRVRTELTALGDPPAHRDIADLPYLRAVCAETLRHGSVVPAGFARIAPHDLHWAGHHIPAGTELVPAIHLVHHRADLYPDPERFDPERFLDRKPGGTHYLPFGIGTRRCPGAELAEFELPLVLARLLRTPGLRLTGAQPGLCPLKNGPATTIPTSVGITLDAPAHRAPRTEDGRP